MNTSLGYTKKTLTNSNVLLSGGGDKALSEFIGSLNWDSTNKKLQYKSVSSTNFIDLITFGSNAFTSYSGYNIVFLDNAGTNVDTFKALISPSKTLKAGTNVQMTADSNVITITATDTWNANAVGVAGYVAAPTKAANANMTWLTNAEGVPAWRASNNHSHSYLPLSGGTLNSGSMIAWKDWGQWGAENPTYPKANGGLQWAGTSDTIKLFAEETASDDLRLVLLFGDDNNPRFEIRDKNGNANAYITTDGAANFTALTVNNTAVSLSGHKHAYTDLTGSSTTANLAIVSSGTADGWTLKTLGSNAFNSTSYLPLAGGTMTADSAISWGNNDRTDWNTYVTGLKIISSTTENSGAPTRYSTALSVVGRYGFLLAALGGNVNTFYIRNTNNGIWRVLIHSGNYTSYKHAYTNLTGSGTIADQAIVSTGTANGWTLKTLGSHAFDSTVYATPDTTTTLTRASGNLTKDTWSDVGSFADTVPEGTWVISFTIDGSIYSGVFSRKKSDTMSEEIDLHAAGTSAKRIYARTTGNKIQIATADATFNPGEITFNFRKLI